MAQVLFLLGVFLKQFYVFSSGGFQVGDLFFMSSFLIMLFFVMHGKIPLGGSDGLFICFVGFVVLINTIYICIYGNDYPGEFRFQKSVFYYIYNLFIILSFRQLSTDLAFLRKLKHVLQAAILVQLLVSFTGLGRFVYSRFTGTFNDPNQCGFYVFASFLMIFIISHISKEKPPLLWFFVAVYLIMRTASTGMLLGMAALFVFFVFFKISDYNMKSAIAFLVFAGGLLAIVSLASVGVIRLPSSITNSSMYYRVMGKISFLWGGQTAARAGSIRNLLVDRCWDRVFDYPTKLLYGAGEGYYHRFPSARYVRNEIHSSVLGPLFCYGIIPCSFWFVWTYRQLKGIRRDLWPAFLALIIESLTLVNNRQPFFWMIFVLAGSVLSKKCCSLDSMENHADLQAE